MRALLDANVLLRAFLPSTVPTRAVNLLLEAGLSGKFVILLPPELLAEIIEKAITKPYLAARIGPERVHAFAGLLLSAGESLQPYSGPFPAIGRDPKDDYLLPYARSGASDYLVSDDKDLHAVDDTALPFEIVSSPEFLKILRDQGLV